MSEVLKLKLLLTVSITKVTADYGRSKIIEEVTIEVSPTQIARRLLPVPTRPGFTDFGYMFDVTFFSTKDTNVFKYGQRIGNMLNGYFSEVYARTLYSYINPDTEHSYAKWDSSEQNIIKELRSRICKDIILDVNFKYLSSH
jgi:hypothetical protein